MQTLFQDIRFGARVLLHSPGMTVAVILALALGIGANTAMFSVVDALILHPLRYQNPSELVVVWDRDAQGQLRGASSGNFLDWRKAKSFSAMAGWAASSYTLTGLDQPQQIYGARVTAQFFTTLGVKPLLGRTFLQGEDGLDGSGGGSKVAVIGYDTWQNFLSGDPNVLGRTIRLNQVPYAIIGVMGPEFQFLSRRHQVWVPAVLDTANRDYRYLTVIARLNTSRGAAGAEMTALTRSLQEAYPKSNTGWAIQVDDFQDYLVNRRIRTRLLILFAAVGAVLLLACTNVASLLLARSAARGREIAVRVSMGATPARVVRQLLTESVMLALMGAGLGLALAALLIDLAPGFVPANAIPTTAPIQLNFLVLSFTLGIAVLTGVLFGLAPALSLARPDVRDTLNDASRGSTGGRGRQRFRQAMVVIEVAVALVLLAGAALMSESLRHMTDIDLGFDPSRVLTLRVFLPVARYNGDQAYQFHVRAMEKIAALPGVESVAMGTNLPLARLSMYVPFDLDTASSRTLAERPDVGYTTISGGYLHTLGIPLKRGRDFTDRDRAGAPTVALINEAFAALHFPHQDPVGRQLLLNPPMLGQNGFADPVRAEIVGVTGNVKLNDLNAAPEPILYLPLGQNIWSTVTYLTVRTRTNATSLAAAIRHEMADLDKEQPVDQLGSMEQNFSDQFAEPRFQSRLMGAFAALALILAVVGIYGVNAYAVTQRRRELGVRIALGARPSDVLRETLGEGLKLSGIGIGLGLAGAYATSSLLSSVLVGVAGTNPLTLLGAAAVLAAVALAACYIPARRATRIDPASALRQE
ncbi:MAG TPA: ABC transporter permease [Bryobacteraceae bacterium]|nr:ABC transporter permease [Bryobacteraceae bacterium]